MASAGRQALLDLLRPGARVYVQGATGEPMDFVRLLEAEPARANGVTFVSCLVPGMNAFDYASLDDGARLETFMLSPALRASFAAGKTAILPLRYSLIAQRMAADAFDLAVLHVAPPDEAGLCSFGVACDFGPMAWPRAKRVAAFVNPAMPRLKRGPAIAFSSIDLVLEAETAPLHAPRATASEDLRAAAAHAAAFAPDGAAIQTGIGAAPAAILPFLKDRRGLRIASGMVSEEYRDLADAGALADRALHCTGIAWGGLDFYDYLAREDLTAFAVADVTHDVDMLGEIPAFISFGSALEADLFGQINLEWRRGEWVSGVGGAPDFARAAQRSTGGAAIIALPATAGAASRIVPQLSQPSVSLPRDLADVIVTEHGAARLRGLSLDARAEAMIAIAAPQARGDLTDRWRAMRARF